jgi:peptide/nickel transport system substrate-binding protein
MDVEPPHLNPLLQEDVWLARITINNLFEGLVRRHPTEYRFLPTLATRWEFSADGRVLTFTLREGVRFHDGEAFSAEDVIFTFDRLMDPAVAASSTRSDFSDLRQWEALGDGRVRLRFARPGFKILESLSHLSILPKHVYGVGDLNQHPANHRPVGTGPFRFDTWQRGRFVRLARFERYWGDKPALERVVYRLVRSKQKALGLVKRGELDLMPRVLPQQACGADAPIRQPAITRRYRTVIHYPVQFYTAIFNFQNELFSDVRVRRAVALLVRRRLIADKIFCGRARLIGGPYWPGKPGNDPAVKPRRFDPRRADRLLSAAGWKDTDGDGVRDKDGKRFSFSYLRFAESSVQRRLLPLVREQLAKAGLEMNIETISWTAGLKRLKQHRFDMTDLNWHYYFEQDLYQIYHSSQCDGGSNYGCYRNPTVDALLVKIRRTLDDEARHALERKLHRLLHEDLPGLYLFNVGDVSLISRRFTGLEPSPEWFQVRDARPASDAPPARPTRSRSGRARPTRSRSGRARPTRSRSGRARPTRSQPERPARPARRGGP